MALIATLFLSLLRWNSFSSSLRKASFLIYMKNKFLFDSGEKQNFHRKQTLKYANGYMFPQRPEIEIGGDLDIEDIVIAPADPVMPVDHKVYLPASQCSKVLRFFCYFKETIHESPQEFYRVRSCQIFYYLEDDSIAVTEPKVENSGIPQGVFLRRHQIPKNERGDKWHWTDLNNGVNVTFYGRTFHICDCDAFTKDFLQSEGIELAPPCIIPPDPYTYLRRKSSKH